MKKRYTAQEMRIRADYLEVAQADAKTAAMLRQAADDMEREKKYEYAVHFVRNGKMVGRSAGHYHSYEEAMMSNTYCPSGEAKVFVRREVGEWEEVSE